jgi:predicted 3-demethylubiquinone-9 3-methyltransferase (glyoxalase superfamily)
MTNSILPCLWFDGNAKEAAEFYCGIFKDAKIISVNPVVVIFEMNNTRFMGLNGGPKYKFTEAVSFMINCDSQEEIDHYWNALTAGGEESRCGWLKDKFGLSWQVVPGEIGKLMSDPERAPRVMNAILSMNKLDLEKLRNA